MAEEKLALVHLDDWEDRYAGPIERTIRHARRALREVARRSGTAGFHRRDLGSHKGNEARRRIEARGACLLFLPPISPDLNPIDLAFAKLEALLRKAGERSVENIWTRIGELLDAVTPQECRNDFKHTGYA